MDDIFLNIKNSTYKKGKKVEKYILKKRFFKYYIYAVLENKEKTLVFSSQNLENTLKILKRLKTLNQ